MKRIRDIELVNQRYERSESVNMAIANQGYCKSILTNMLPSY